MRLGTGELERLEAAIAEVERSTRAELVVAVARAAAPYREVGWALATTLGVAALGVVLFAPWFTVRPALAGAIVVAAALAGYAGGALLDPLRRACLGRGAMARAVDRAAKVALVEEGVTASAERSGVLVYVSCFEPAVRVLTDLGVQGRLPDAAWGALEADTAAELRQGRLETALLGAIRRAGALLAEHFPPRPGDVDEVPNRIRVRGC